MLLKELTYESTHTLTIIISFDTDVIIRKHHTLFQYITKDLNTITKIIDHLYSANAIVTNIQFLRELDRTASVKHTISRNPVLHVYVCFPYISNSNANPNRPVVKCADTDMVYKIYLSSKFIISHQCTYNILNQMISAIIWPFGFLASLKPQLNIFIFPIFLLQVYWVRETHCVLDTTML